MRFELCLLAIMALFLLSLPKGADAQDKRSVYQLDAIPGGYSLYAYDDCGVGGRQPHVDMTDTYNFTFALSDTDADIRSRSAVFSYKSLKFNYEDLDRGRSYVLAMTYASDHVYKRVQSLWANGVELHGPMPLPNAKAIRAIVKVPGELTKDGKLALEIKIHGEVNATASIVELWATGPAVPTVRFASITAVPGGVVGRVVDIAHTGIKGAVVRAYPPENKTDVIAETTTDENGRFLFVKRIWKGKYDDTGLRITASWGGTEVSEGLLWLDLGFEPVRYRPVPTSIAGPEKHRISLDGTWKIDVNPSDDVRDRPLTAGNWASVQAPGQWKQQGFEVPLDRVVAMAREFEVPDDWSGSRIFLRFDAIHAGVEYWVNGKKLGYSENLFTPVEWEITDAVRPGKGNRIDLRMKMDTVSERLSYSTGYAFHSLAGIDRSISIYAAPRIGIKDLRVLTDLDSAYRDAKIKLRLTLDNAAKEVCNGLSLAATLTGPDGKPAKLTTSGLGIGTLEPGEKAIESSIDVTNPLKWSAEKPNLYGFVLELKQGDTVLERIERNLGFRKIERRGSLVYVNGQPVKLAGACHHEFDPVTGRADTRRHAELDVKLAKEINLNYLRTSHYPPTEEFLDACDRLGMYVEAEAPFCWVQPTDDLGDLRHVLIPTSAMVDVCHTHPSVIIWSVANESTFNEYFEYADRLIREFDPTRLTTFNNPDPKQICDIANVHYPLMPYDDVMKDDPRPLFLGEYWFPVCHEQTDVMLNPGLRELWGHGHADPDSDFAKLCAKSFEMRLLMPGVNPGAWTHIYNSKRVIGGAIWALLDEAFYFKDGTHAGYAWHHGFWGLIDSWRRPKPEAWLSKMIFSPVWFPVRQLPLAGGQESVSIPVENRYSFTDLSELVFSYRMNGKQGKVKVEAAPGKRGKVTIPLPKGTKDGDRLTIDVTNRGALVTTYAVALGKQQATPVPQPTGGAPEWSDDGKTIVVKGSGFAIAIDRKTGRIDSAHPAHKAAITSLPALHLTRRDYGDLNGPKSPPYAIFPDAKTRVVEDVTLSEKPAGLEITVKDRYDGFAGSATWLIDKSGTSKVSTNYTYSGDEMDTREVGIAVVLKPQCDELRWKRWSEWGDVFPKDSISRTEGVAKARRPKAQPDVPDTTRPAWPWALDQTEMGTNDFRSVKFNIYNASVVAADGSGVEALSDAKAHVRACLVPEGVKMHMLSECPLGPVKLKSGDRIKGEFIVKLRGAKAK